MHIEAGACMILTKFLSVDIHHADRLGVVSVIVPCVNNDRYLFYASFSKCRHAVSALMALNIASFEIDCQMDRLCFLTESFQIKLASFFLDLSSYLIGSSSRIQEVVRIHPCNVGLCVVHSGSGNRVADFSLHAFCTIGCVLAAVILAESRYQF